MPFGISHPPIRQLAHSAITTFFREIEVLDADNIPDDGPVIFSSSHANMAVDPACLSSTVPQSRMLHYWVKDSLFKNPVAGAILRNAGNIPVDRKSKNNQSLFRGTFEALALGESIAVFPEGTSHTEPRLLNLKDGVSWSALEYVRYLNGTPESGGPKKGDKAKVVPVGIVYEDKSKWRSRVVVRFGPSISMDEYEPEFLSENEGAARSAVKKLTRRIEIEMFKLTVNAPDWDTLYAATMARQLLWETKQLALTEYVDVTQTLIDLFTSDDPALTSLKKQLVTYHNLLLTSRLSNDGLAALPLPQSYDPKYPASLPSRFTALFALIRDSLWSLFKLPFFLVPLVIHIPIYVVAVLGGELVKDETETVAQMKIAFGLLLSFLMYPILFACLYVVLRTVPLGAVVAAGIVWLFARYHLALIDDNYESMKRLVAAWRVLIGVWMPKRFDYPLDVLQSSFASAQEAFAAKVAAYQEQLNPSKPVEDVKHPTTPGQIVQKAKRNVLLPPGPPPIPAQKLPSRKLVRLVLRTRNDARAALIKTLADLEDSGSQVPAKFWLAERFGGDVEPVAQEGDEWERPLPVAYRRSEEVVAFLRERGGLVLPAGDGDWAASSGEE